MTLVISNVIRFLPNKDRHELKVLSNDKYTIQYCKVVLKNQEI